MVKKFLQALTFQSMPNFALKWDNAPAAYGTFFDGSEVNLRFYFAVGRYPLAQVVRVFYE